MSNLKVIDRRIKSIRTVGAKYVAMVQECAIMIVEHASETGDCSRALSLANELSTADKKLIASYFRFVSPINLTFSKEGDRVRLFKRESPNYNPFDMTKATNLSWRDDLSGEKPEKENDTVHVGGVFEELDKVLKRVEKNETKGKTYSPEAVAAIAAIRANLVTLQTELLANRATTAPVPVAPVAWHLMAAAA